MACLRMWICVDMTVGKHHTFASSHVPLAAVESLCNGELGVSRQGWAACHAYSHPRCFWSSEASQLDFDISSQLEVSIALRKGHHAVLRAAMQLHPRASDHACIDDLFPPSDDLEWSRFPSCVSVHRCSCICSSPVRLPT
jgi:hypothetical protein